MTAGAVVTFEGWASRAAEHGLQLDELQRLSECLDMDLKALLDAMATHVAEQYVSKTWTFDYCCQAMNELFGFMRAAKQCPDRAFAIFFAFCAGQATHDRASHGEPAEDAYTRPMIAKMICGRVDGVA